MKKYTVLALASAVVSLGEIEAENNAEAWRLANELFKKKRGNTVSSIDFLDSPTIEELDSVEVGE